MRLVWILALVASCSSGAKKPPTTIAQAGAAVLRCGEVEAAAVAASVSVLDVDRAVEAAIALASSGGFTAVEQAIEGLIVKYGEPIVACAVLRGLEPASSGAGAPLVAAAAPEPTAPAVVRRQLAIAHQWAEASP